jgi:glutathione reductase (NADPH)
MERFDAIVIGTGVAGQTAAGELSAAGKRVAVIDRREFGGTCALRGCEPKKVLFTAAEVAERAAAQAGNGVSGALRVDWTSLVAFKRTFTDPIPSAIERSLTEGGAVALHGEARCVSEDTIGVGGTEHAADHFVIATGAVPRPLGIPGAGLVTDAEGFMAADALGERVAVIGGGYISFEFAHIAAAAGARAVVLHRGARVLEGFDPDLAEMLARGYRDAGIEVRTEAVVSEVREAGGALEIVCGNGDVVVCDMAVHGAGRVPDTGGLGLEAAGVAYGPRGVEVDDTMRSTTNPRVFAAGDAAASGVPLTPVGIAQARVVVANILEPGSATFSPIVTPSVVFSDPPLASVGLTEAQAREIGLGVEVKLTDTASWASSRRVGQRVSGAKTIVDRGSGRIVGAHLLGHGAEEVVNVFAAAIAGGLTASDLKRAVWAYPTASSEIVYLL